MISVGRVNCSYITIKIEQEVKAVLDIPTANVHIFTLHEYLNDLLDWKYVLCYMYNILYKK